MNLDIVNKLNPRPEVYEWCRGAARSPLPGAWVDLVVLAMGAAYALAAVESESKPQGGQVLCFVASLAVLVLALSGPMERLALDRLFLAYILQQIAITMIIAPLLLLGATDWMLRPLLAVPIIAPVWRLLTKPMVALLLFAGVFAIIHSPAVCDQVCHVRPFYYSVRIVLLLVGILLWWPLLSTLVEFPRLSYPLQVLYLFILTIPMVAVSAPIALAQSVLYSFYVEGPHPLGLTALADQELGGLVMWVGQGLYVTIVASVIFFRWIARSETGDQPVVRDTRFAGL